MGVSHAQIVLESEAIKRVFNKRLRTGRSGTFVIKRFEVDMSKINVTKESVGTVVVENGGNVTKRFVVRCNRCRRVLVTRVGREKNNLTMTKVVNSLHKMGWDKGDRDDVHQFKWLCPECRRKLVDLSGG